VRGCTVTQPQPGHLVIKIDSLGAGDGATVSAAAGGNLSSAPRLPAPPSGVAASVYPLLPGLLAASISLLAAAAASMLIRRRGRERVAAGASVQSGWSTTTGQTRVDAAGLEALVPVGAAPPSELTPAQGGVLLAEGVLPEHMVAWLIDAAAHGYFDIEGHDDDRPVLVRRTSAPAGAADPMTAALLDQVFAGRDRVRLGGYDPSFAEAWRDLGRQRTRLGS
jgi:hypothetical protein